jgi:hypothetical protein
MIYTVINQAWHDRQVKLFGSALVMGRIGNRTGHMVFGTVEEANGFVSDGMQVYSLDLALDQTELIDGRRYLVDTATLMSDGSLFG